MPITQRISIDPKKPDIAAVKRVAAMVRAGAIVALPTETVYGLTCNLDNASSVERLYEVKQRPGEKRFTLHVARKGDIDVYTAPLSCSALRIVGDFMPGPLTIIANAKSGRDTIAIRCPSHPVCQLVLEASFARIGMPSANLSGQPPALTADEVLSVFDGQIDAVVDAGPLTYGISSTIVDVTQGMPRILREGAIETSAIMRSINSIRVLFVCTGNTCRSAMAQHYFSQAYHRYREQLTHTVQFDSCGTMAAQGSPLSCGAEGALEEMGIRDVAHASKILSASLVKTADLIVCMTTWHKESVMRLKPLAETNVSVMSDFSDKKQYFDVPDPMGGSHDEYMHVMHIIQDAEKELFAKITAIDTARRKE
jgi:L-threonylcarbamoyladenylate synthase